MSINWLTGSWFRPRWRSNPLYGKVSTRHVCLAFSLVSIFQCLYHLPRGAVLALSYRWLRGLGKGQYHLVRAFQKLQSRNATLTLVGTILPGWDKRLHLEQPGLRATGHQP